MADLCTCGHDLDDWREHTYDPTEDRYVCMHPAPGASGWRTRSPLSAFRGPAVSFTRADASDALLLLNCGGAAYAVRNLDPDQLREVVRIYVRGARANATDAPGLAAVQLLAARILRAVRP